MNRLLIMACSGAKTRQAGHSAPAIALYDGPTWRTLRAWVRRHPVQRFDLDVLALSAQYGLINAQTYIQSYDRILTAARVVELDTPESRRLLVRHLEACAHVPDHRLISRPLFVGGALYAALLDRLMPGWSSYDHAAAGAPNAGIGYQLEGLSRWLERR